MRAPGSRLLMLTRTGAPAARFRARIPRAHEGTAAPTTPTPTTVVHRSRSVGVLHLYRCSDVLPQKKVERICRTCPLTFSTQPLVLIWRARKSTGHKTVRQARFQPAPTRYPHHHRTAFDKHKSAKRKFFGAFSLHTEVKTLSTRRYGSCRLIFASTWRHIVRKPALRR